jgi:hypothetical protein
MRSTATVLGPAAEHLEPKEPLAATLLYRKMIEFTLDRARSSRYGHAARHLRSCAWLVQGIGVGMAIFPTRIMSPLSASGTAASQASGPGSVMIERGREAGACSPRRPTTGDQPQRPFVARGVLGRSRPGLRPSATTACQRLKPTQEASNPWAKIGRLCPFPPLPNPWREVSVGEGFRMPARRDLSSRTWGRRPKAPQEGTRGGWVSSLPSMGICRGGGLRRGCADRGDGRWTDDRGRDFVAASAVDGVFLASSTASHALLEAPGQQ